MHGVCTDYTLESVMTPSLWILFPAPRFMSRILRIFLLGYWIYLILDFVSGARDRTVVESIASLYIPHHTWEIPAGNMQVCSSAD